MQKNDQFWVVCGLIGFAVVVTFFTGQIFDLVATEAGFYGNLLLPRLGASLFAGIAGTAYLAGSHDRMEYFRNSVGELRKVVFPTKEETSVMTRIVVVFCVIFGLFLAVIDFIWRYILAALLTG